MNESSPCDFLNAHENPVISRSQPKSPATGKPISVDNQSARLNSNDTIAQESYYSMFISPSKNLRGLKGNGNNAEEIIDDHELAHRRAEEAGLRRYQAAGWLRKMDRVASEVLPEEPTEEEFCLGLRNGLILCNVLNKVNPGAVHKVVENPVVDVEATEGAAQSAIQYFENMRNFLVAVGKMKLLTFEASDLEKGGSSAKVVECILCLKGYFEWKQSGGLGVWRYGGTVRITSLVKEPTSSVVSSEGADESTTDDSDSESLQYNQLIQFLKLSTRSHEKSREANVLSFMFDHFSLGLLKSYLAETNGFEDTPLNSTVIDIVLKKVSKDFSALLVSRGHQLGLFLNHVLNSDHNTEPKTRFLEAISKYLSEKSSLVSRDVGNFCICGGKGARTCNGNISSQGGLELLNLQHKQLEGLKSLFKETKEELHRVQLGLVEEVQSVGHHVKGLEVAASSYHKVLEENRILYNQVQDLKGSIRVFCRVRPFLPGQPNEQSTVDYIGENGKIMIVNPLKPQGKNARRAFLFNKVFGTNVTQQDIYDDTQQLIRSVLDGYNVCIFAYGQTGSGKTYTMSGPDLMTKETWGVNYRALCDLFHICKSRMNIVEYEVGVQMIEIYNEQVRDLLVSDGSNRRLDIRNNSQLNGLNVPDASLVPVKTSQDVFDLMKIGQRNRAVGATALNGRSSRSHSVLTVHVRGKELLSGSILKGCLHLVDLAGSERLDKSEAIGERLKEAQHINKSLSALGDVISALAQKSSHIPYRNSKLTQVLQDSLGGHAKTLMFVHINPDVNALGETISTLKFAERVATIDLGAAQSNKETTEIRDFKEEISNLKLTLERKESELEQFKRGAVSVSVSPVHLPKLNTNANLNLKPESNQLNVDAQYTERRSRFPSKFVDKDVVSKMLVLGEKRSTSSIMPRYPSPSIRTSSPYAVNVRTRLNQGLKEQTFPDALDSPSQRLRKVQNGIEEDQIKQALNVRQGFIRKAKPEGKVRIKQKSGVVEAQKIELSGPENEHRTLVKKFHHRNHSRDSQNVELRELIHTVEPSFYQENKVSSTVSQKRKDTVRPSVSEIRRSMSTPRGRYMI